MCVWGGRGGGGGVRGHVSIYSMSAISFVFSFRSSITFVIFSFFFFLRNDTKWTTKDDVSLNNNSHKQKPELKSLNLYQTGLL